MHLENVDVAPPIPEAWVHSKQNMNAALKNKKAESGSIHVMLYWPGYDDDLDLALRCFLPGAEGEKVNFVEKKRESSEPLSRLFKSRHAIADHTSNNSMYL